MSEPTPRTRLYRIGPELEDQHYALVHNGLALRYENGDLTVARFPDAAAAYFRVTGAAVERPVDVEGRAFSVREAEILERVQIIRQIVTPQMLAGILQHPKDTALTLFGDGGWRFGALEEGVETPPVLWQTSVSAVMVKLARDEFLRQIQQESQERIDVLRNSKTGEYV